MKIYLSPSNQNTNPYWSGVGGTERDWMNRIADVTQRELTKNHQVIRAGLATPIATRATEANKAGVDLYLAIHSDGANGQARGTTTFHYPGSANGLRFAQAVNRRIMEIYPGPNRGIKADATLTETKTPNAPAVLVEVAFHDNPTDAQWIASNVEAIGVALAKAVNDYAGITSPAPSTPAPTPKPEEIAKPPVNTTGRNITSRPTADIQRLVGATPDSVYGPDTTSKVKTWQGANGLDADGIWGPLSDAKGFPKAAATAPTARPTINKGSKGEHVKAAQNRLNTLGYSVGKAGADGDFGNDTDKATRAFQKAKSLVVDGIIGPNTWKALGI